MPRNKWPRGLRKPFVGLVRRYPRLRPIWLRAAAIGREIGYSLHSRAGEFGSAPGAEQTLSSIRRHLVMVAASVAILLTGVGILGAKTDLSGAVVASGSLVVESNVKKVQHPVGGTVGELLVKDGTRVEAGDTLLRLDETVARSNLSALANSLWELRARGARLEAERDAASELNFPSDLLQAAADDPAIGHIVDGERNLFGLRREALVGQKTQLHERVSQLQEEIKGLTEQADAKTEEIRLVQVELGGVRELWEKRLIPIARLTALERDAARLKGERGQLVASTAQAKGKISELEVQTLQVDQNMRSDVGKEMADIRAKSAELIERKIAAQDLLTKLDIRSPQRGVVQDLSVHARGSVVGPAETIMTIVPEADALVVEVHIAPQDIDQVRLEQPAVLRFPNFNQRVTPELDGNVMRISPDVTKDAKTGLAYYLARVRIASHTLTEEMKFVPGMPVDVFIRTADRTLLSYLMKPLTDQAARAFREK